MRFRSLLLLIPLALVAACNETTAPSGTLEGTYTATIFRVRPTGQAEVDVISAGGSLTIVIAEDNSTTGELSLPPSVSGGITASMAGTAQVSGSTVVFQQPIDTFVRELTWSWSGSSLVVSNQTISDGTYTITLTRQ